MTRNPYGQTRKRAFLSRYSIQVARPHFPRYAIRVRHCRWCYLPPFLATFDREPATDNQNGQILNDTSLWWRG